MCHGDYRTDIRRVLQQLAAYVTAHELRSFISVIMIIIIIISSTRAPLRKSLYNQSVAPPSVCAQFHSLIYCNIKNNVTSVSRVQPKTIEMVWWEACSDGQISNQI